MAIFGTISALEKQSCKRTFGKVYEFLRSTDLQSAFAEVAPGKKKTIEIAGKEVYAILSEYDVKTRETAKIEGHREYIDVQYIYQGRECIGYADLAEAEGDIDYNAEKDIYFCQSRKLSFVQLNEGEGAILFPDDLHAPCIGVQPGEHVKKIVFKVKVGYKG